MASAETAGQAAALPEDLLLDDVQARVMGSLVEKQATTPEQYPLTANAVLLACNQKTARGPVLELEPGAVGHALRVLEERRLVRSQHGSRAQRYEHRFAERYGVTVQQQALLALLLLRGPQTATELATRSERLAPIADADEARHLLDRLAQRSPALVVAVPRAAGQREPRFMHLLCGPVDIAALAGAAPSPDGTAVATRVDIAARLQALEARVEEIEAALAQFTRSSQPG